MTDENGKVGNREYSNQNFYLKGTSFTGVVKKTGFDSPEYQCVGHAILVFIHLRYSYENGHEAPKVIQA